MKTDRHEVYKRVLAFTNRLYLSFLLFTSIFFHISRYVIRCKTVDDRGKIVLDFELEVCEIPSIELIGKGFNFLDDEIQINCF